MRIISGKYRGRIIQAPRNLPVRPTTDFAKTALFNIINSHFNDFGNLKVLDLFCGTGNISFEFISRGCNNIYSVDIHPAAVKFVKQKVVEMDADSNRVICSDAFRFISHWKLKSDIIFADPPYQLETVSELPGLIFKHQLLLPGGWFILEHKPELHFDSFPHFSESRKYGNVAFSIFVNKLDSSIQ